MNSIVTLNAAIHTREQLLTSTYSARGITRACKNSELLKLARNIYIPAQKVQNLKPWERYTLKVLTRYRASPSTVFSHRSAASLLGLALPSHPDHKVHVYCDAHSRGTHDGVVKHPRLTAETPHLVTGVGAIVTDVATTVIDCAHGLSFREASMVADSALAQNMISLEELTEKMAAFNRRGHRRVHRVAGSLSALSESPGETLVRLLLDELGIRYVQQYWVGNYRADFYLPDYGAFIEFDGVMKYSEFGEYVEVLRAERDRERSFLNSGARIFRVDWDLVWRRPEVFKAQLQAFLNR